MGIKISVVIPTFRRPQLLLKCLNALKHQDFLQSDYEVIIVTDGPDETTKTEVSYFIHQHSLTNFLCTGLQQKAGPAAARNRGLKISKGELIVFTDDDCLPQTGFLPGYWSAYITHRNSDIAFTGKTIVPHSDRPTDYEKNIANLETAEFITANCACSKHAFKKVGGFDEEFPVAWREDSEFQFKLIAASVPIIKVEDAVVIHPVRHAPWGVSLKEQKKSKYNALLLKKHPLLYEERIGAKPLWNYYAIVLLTIVIILSFISKKQLVGGIAGTAWIFLLTHFILKRLQGTSKKVGHVIEMVATSIFIPFLSVFWTLYGSFRYKKLLL